ncbi:MAG: NAD-dependent epimerase/dehydratase family protein [Gammaproteobacteria bacterium]|nr:NAD-dependent epimerase/dehydratase family protein [Gammaproteobacteria bacterium]
MPVSEIAIPSVEKLILNQLIDFTELNNRTIILTGATGFFGKWLLSLFAVLNNRNVSVKIIAFSRDPEQFLLKEPYFRNTQWLRWEKTDLSKKESVALEFKSDYIIHAATDTSLEAHSDPSNMLWGIIDSWRNLLSIAQKSGSKRIMNISSGAVYGRINENGASENDYSAMDFTNPKNAYALGKQLCEQSAVVESRKSGLSIITARCFAFAGAGLPLDQGYAIGNFVKDAIEGKDIRIKGDGRAVRSYLYAGDLAVWLVTLLLKGKPGEAYNVGSDEKITIAELANLIKKNSHMSGEVKIEGENSAGFGHNFYYPQIVKSRSLGLNVWTKIDVSVEEMYEFSKA